MIIWGPRGAWVWSGGVAKGRVEKIGLIHRNSKNDCQRCFPPTIVRLGEEQQEAGFGRLTEQLKVPIVEGQA